jgi:hypothetical protein
MSLPSVLTHWNGMKITGIQINMGPCYPIGVVYPMRITSIEPYAEPGEMGYTVWFEITIKDVTSDKVFYRRVNGSHVTEVEFEASDVGMSMQ